MSTSIQPIRIEIDSDTTVSGLVQAPPDARAVYVLAHGAGAGMAHSFMAAAAQGLAERSVATLRYQFPYMERGSKRTDPPAVAHAAVRAAVARAAQEWPGLRLFAGGKSFGGRMTSQAQAAEPLPSVQGLVFLGFPLHPDGAPSSTRAEHLRQVHAPMLFVQGTRDKLADIERMRALAVDLGERATLMEIAEADHSFQVLVRSGRKNPEVMQEVLDGAARWMLR
ncbi:MAG: alpha/beta hydrolase [Proteobacteria bacterium]|nr:alpha/beta hydrolase [Pseudomonadota bacterium]